MIQMMDNNYIAAQNRYNNDSWTGDSFCEPAFSYEGVKPPKNMSMHRRSPSTSMARMVWRLKKRVASSIFK